MLCGNARTAATMALFAVLLPGAAVAECRPVAGTIDATVLGGDPVLSGHSAENAGTVSLTLEHDFVTDTRGSLKTTDTAVWTPVPGHAGVFHMATEYAVVGGTGGFADAQGTLRNEGIADTNTGLVTLRYDGEICVN